MNARKILVFALAGTLLAGCQDPYGRPNAGVMQGGGINKQDVGTVAGAIGGGVIGHQFGGGRGQVAATIAGTLLGGMLGNQVGASLDRADMAYYNQTSQRALETAQPGQTLPWSNPQSGNSGTITPQAYYENNGRYCREYTQTIKVGGRSESGHGTACREPDGTWQIVQ